MNLVTHADTVFDPESGFLNFTLDEAQGIATGPGVIDDKGGIVIALEGLKRFFTRHRAMMKTSWRPTRSRKLSKRGAMAPPSPWQKSVWPELHHLRRHQPEMAEIGLMKQLGAMKRFHSEKENVDEHLLSDV